MSDPITRDTLPVPLPVAVIGSPVRAATDPDRVGVLVDSGRGGLVCVYWCWSECAEWLPPSALLLDLIAPLGPTVLARLIAEHVGLDVSRGVVWARVESVDGDESWFEVAASGRRWRHPIQPEDEDVRFTLAAVARHLFGGSDV